MCDWRLGQLDTGPRLSTRWGRLRGQRGSQYGGPFVDPCIGPMRWPVLQAETSTQTGRIGLHWAWLGQSSGSHAKGERPHPAPSASRPAPAPLTRTRGVAPPLHAGVSVSPDQAVAGPSPRNCRALLSAVKAPRVARPPRCGASALTAPPGSLGLLMSMARPVCSCVTVLACPSNAKRFPVPIAKGTVL